MDDRVELPVGFGKQALRVLTEFGAYRRIYEETGDMGPLLAYIEDEGRWLGAITAASLEAINEAGPLTPERVAEHYLRLYPDAPVGEVTAPSELLDPADGERAGD